MVSMYGGLQKLNSLKIQASQIKIQRLSINDLCYVPNQTFHFNLYKHTVKGTYTHI